MRPKLTDRRLRSLHRNPPSKRLEMIDDEGLLVRVAPSGRVTFAHRYRRGGRQVAKTLGLYPDMSLAEARDEILRRRGALAAGKSVDRPRRADDLLVRDLAERWVAELRRLAAEGKRRPSYVDQVEDALDRDVLDAIGLEAAAAVEPFALASLLAKKAARYPTAANRLHAYLSRMYRWARSRPDLLMGLGIDPMLEVARPAEERRRERVLDWQELRDLWAWCETHDDARAIGLQLLLMTGVRVSDACGRSSRSETVPPARSDEVDEDGWWTVPADRTKGRQRPASWLHPHVRQRLETLKGPWLLPGRDGGLRSLKYARARVQRDHPPASPAWTLHDIRRTVSTRLPELGISPGDVDLVMGHRGGAGSARTRYMHTVRFPAVRDALRAWGDHVIAVTSPNVVRINRSA